MPAAGSARHPVAVMLMRIVCVAALALLLGFGFAKVAHADDTPIPGHTVSAVVAEAPGESTDDTATAAGVCLLAALCGVVLLVLSLFGRTHVMASVVRRLPPPPLRARVHARAHTPAATLAELSLRRT